MDLSGTCPICFEDLKERETATPDICDHVFCLDCLQKWAKQGSFCPVDRKKFKNIIDLGTSTLIKVKPRKRRRQPELYDVTRHCEVCSKTSRADSLLQCVCCDLSYHCSCLTPPLTKKPLIAWTCPICVAVGQKIESKKGLTKNVESVVEDFAPWDYSSSSSASDGKSSKLPPILSKKTLNIKSSNASKKAKSDQFDDKSTSKLPLLSDIASDSKSSDNEFRSRKRSKRIRSPRKSKNDASKLWSLRPRHITKSFYIDTSSEDERGNCSYTTRNSTSAYSSMNLASTANQLAQSKPLDLTNYLDKDSINICDKLKYIEPEATVTSYQVDEEDNSNSVMSDICVIDSINSLTCSEQDVQKTTESTSKEGYQDVDKTIPFEKISECELPISNLENIDKANTEKALGRNSDSSGHCDIEKQIQIEYPDSNLPNEGNLMFGNDHLEIKLDPDFKNEVADIIKRSDSVILVDVKKETPVLSVFEKSKDESTSQKKYSDIKLAAESKAYDFNTRNLREIQNEKWKTYDLRASKSRKLSHRLKCCIGSGPHPCLGDTVHIGRHFRHKKHSESFGKLQSIPQPLWSKAKWNKYDTVIVKNFSKLMKKRINKIQNIYNSTSNPSNPYSMCLNNNTASNSEKSFDEFSINKLDTPDMISNKTDKLLELKETESKLLSAVLCLPDIKNLSANKDHHLFINWQNSNY